MIRSMPLTKLRSSGEFAVWLHAVRVIQRRYNRSLALQIGMFISVAVALVAATAILQGNLQFVQKNAILIARDPLQTPLVLGLGLMSLFLGMSAALSVAGEIESGTLPILVAGPVSVGAFLLAVLLANLVVYGQAAILILVWMFLASWAINLYVSLTILLAVFTSLAIAAAAIALGLLVSSWSRKRRSTIALYVILLVLGISLQAADQVIDIIPVPTEASRNDPFHFIRGALQAIDHGASWVSPFAQFDAMVGALAETDQWSYLAHLLVVVLQTILLVSLASTMLRRQHKEGR